MTESEFHKQRKMFLIRNDCLFEAPFGLDQTHRQWFESLSIDADDAIKNDVRGYYDSTGLYFYKGENFGADYATLKIVERYLPAFEAPPGTKVYVGLDVPQKVITGQFTRFPGKPFVIL